MVRHGRSTTRDTTKRNTTLTEEYIEEPRRSYSRSEYRGMLNYEGIIGGHIQKVMQYRDTSLKQYCSSIETLIIHCPRQIRTKAYQRLHDLGLQRGRYMGINEDKLLVYDDLLIYVNELLEDANLIFRTGQFEIGHD
jgi:hypothetical protein